MLKLITFRSQRVEVCTKAKIVKAKKITHDKKQVKKLDTLDDIIVKSTPEMKKTIIEMLKTL